MARAIKYHTIEEFRMHERARSKKYYQENKEKIAEYKRAYYQRKKAERLAAKEQELNSNK